MPLINYYTYRSLGGDMPLNGKIQTFITTAETSAGDFLYYATDLSGKVTPFVSGSSTTGLVFVGVAKNSVAANGTVTAYVHNDFVLTGWKTVWSGTWEEASSGGGTYTFSGATLNPNYRLRITGSATPGDGSFIAKEIGSSNVTIYSWSDSKGTVSAACYVSAKFTNGNLTINISAGQGNQCGSGPLDCSFTITKIEQYY